MATMGIMRSKSVTLSRREYLRIAVRSAVDPRAVQRVYDGAPARPLTLVAVVRAARSLGLALPTRADEVSDYTDDEPHAA